jgi:hypothetical protein
MSCRSADYSDSKFYGKFSSEIYQFVEWLKDIDFDMASINNDALNIKQKIKNENDHFYNIVNIGSIIIPNNIKSLKVFSKIKYIKKEDDMLFFILSAAIDDEAGILYSNGKINMNGLWKVYRIDKRLFYFQTWL